LNTSLSTSPEVLSPKVLSPKMDFVFGSPKVLSPKPQVGFYSLRFRK
jgi:hypothetical protein